MGMYRNIVSSSYEKEKKGRAAITKKLESY